MHAKLWLRPAALAAALALGLAGCGGGGSDDNNNGSAYSIQSDSFLSEVEKVIASTSETDTPPARETDSLNATSPETVEPAPLG